MNATPQFDDNQTLRIKADIVNKAVNSLQSMPGNCLLSGEDSGLTNTWEEICVQVQGEESFYWETYLDVINDFLASHLEELSQQDRLALWLRTGARRSWRKNGEYDKEVDNEPLVAIYEICDYLRSALMSIAEDFENAAINRYLARQDGTEDEEEEEEEEENQVVDDSDDGASKPTQPLKKTFDYDALWDEVMAEASSEVPLAPGKSSMLDQVYAALDEQSKASLTAALEGLGKIFGFKANSQLATSTEASDPNCDNQSNFTEPGAEHKFVPSNRRESR